MKITLTEKNRLESAVETLISNKEKIEIELSVKEKQLNDREFHGYPDHKTTEEILGAIIARTETTPEDSEIKTSVLKSGKFMVNYDNDDDEAQFVGYYNLVSEKSYTIDENNSGAIEVESYPYPLNTFGPFAKSHHTEWFLEFRIENNINGIEIQSSDPEETDAPVKIFPSPGSICRWRWNIEKISHFSKNDINLFFKFGYKKENDPKPVFQPEKKLASIMILPNTVTLFDKLKNVLSMGNLVAGILFGIISTFFLVKPRSGQTNAE